MDAAVAHGPATLEGLKRYVFLCGCVQEPAQADGYVELLRQHVCNQMDFYLGDENWADDTWLRSKADHAGYVSFNLVAGFNRMRSLVGFLEPDFRKEFVREAVQASQVLELSADGRFVRRRQP